MKKIWIALLPLLFTAQACNFLFGDLYGEGGSGPRGVYATTDSADTWDLGVLPEAAVEQMRIEPGNTDNVVLASVSLGVYASDDRGGTWASLLPSFAAYDIEFNPLSSQEIFVGGNRGQLAQILKTIDRGATWVEVYTVPKGQSTVTRLVLDRSNPRVFYAGLSTGTVLKTSDSGKTWNSVAEVGDRITGLAASGSMVYASTRKKGMMISSDAGRTWKRAEGLDTAGSFNTVEFDPGNFSTVYAGTSSGIYRSRNSGASWENILLPASKDTNDVSAIAVNPKNSGEIFAAIQFVVYRSQDDGATWKAVSLPTKRRTADLEINPDEPNRIYAGLK